MSRKAKRQKIADGIFVLNQKGTWGNYEFYVNIKGKVFRGNFKALKSEVLERFSAWKKDRYSEVMDNRRKFSRAIDEWLPKRKLTLKAGSPQFARDLLHLERALKVIGDKPLHDITSPDISGFLHGLVANGLTNSTANRHRATLSLFFNYCKQQHYMEFNPTFKTNLRENESRHVRLTNQQLDEILNYADDNEMLWLYFSIFTTLRHSEVGGLRWDRIDLDNQQIRILWNETKGKRENRIPIAGIVHQKLLIDRKKHPDAEFVFGFDHPVKSFKTSWATMKKNLRWPLEMDLRIHDLRHIGASRMYEQGVPIWIIQQILGHKDEKTTRIYLNLQNEFSPSVVDTIGINLCRDKRRN